MRRELGEIAGFRCFLYVYDNVSVTKSLHYTYKLFLQVWRKLALYSVYTGYFLKDQNIFLRIAFKLSKFMFIDYILLYVG